MATISATAPIRRPVQRKGVSLKDVNPSKFVEEYAAYLKKAGKVQIPKWVDTIKTGIHKDLPPVNEDWFYIRMASIARKVYIRQGTGVGGLQKHYGGAQRRGTRPNIFVKAAAGNIKKALQALESLGIVEKDPNGGRRITKEGQRELDRIAARVAGRR
eukprot:GEZU01029652.1.p2 GENE.GEZU01029652.1~~GEZU01029652.1.p2  ORF type:complete len:158 (-),score=69.10 GEZU01029652.1:78-551(-)